MARVKIDEMSGYEPPPHIIGKFISKVVQCAPTAEGKSIKFVVEVIDPSEEAAPFAGRQVTEYMSTSTANMREAWQVQQNHARWDAIGKALGLDPADYDTDEQVGKEFTASYYPRKNRDGVLEDAIKTWIPA